jgi:hypothetical protein
VTASSAINCMARAGSKRGISTTVQPSIRLGFNTTFKP